MNKKLFSFSIFGLIFGLFLLFFMTNGFDIADSKSKNLYQQGLEFASSGDYQNAYYNFGKIKPYSDIYTLAVFRQALCADELKDSKTALKKYKKLSHTLSNDDNFTPLILWKIAEYEAENGNTKKAKKLYKKIIKKYPDSDFSKASEYRLAENVEKDNLQLQKKYYISYLEHAPIGRFSSKTSETLKNFYLNESDRVIIANSYYQKKDYKNALEILNKVNTPNANFLKGEIYSKMGNKTSAKYAYYSYLKNIETEEGEKITNATINYVRLSADKNNAFNELLKIENNNSKKGILFHYADYLKNAQSINMYEKICKMDKNGYYAAESLAELFWSAYKKKNYPLALKYSSIHLLNYKNANSTPKILYFTGKINFNLRKKNEAKKYFGRIIKEYPDSYYAYRAMESIKNPLLKFSNLSCEKITTSSKFYIKTNSKMLDKLIILNDVDAINALKLNDNFIKSYVAYKKGLRSYSIVLTRDELSKMFPKPDLKSSCWKLAYPLYYEKEINNVATSYDYSPALALAVIKEESFFEPTAQSSVGATGLMQIMPQTANSLAGRTLSQAELQNPEINIKLGIKYISSLRNNFNNEMLAIASYNAGLGNVKKWRNMYYSGDFDDFVEEIPYLETKTYVKKVFASYWNYSRIYEK